MRRIWLVLLVSTALSAASATPLGDTAALADPTPPAGVVWQDVAPRHFGDGGPATEALVSAHHSAGMPDGTTIIWDRGSSAIRRIDAGGLIETIAGTGQPAPTLHACSLDTELPARSVPITEVGGLWADLAGNVYLWPGLVSRCHGFGDVYRLAAGTDRWQRVMYNGEIADPYFGTSGGYQSITVSPDGWVYASNYFHHVVRRFAGDGSDLHTTGVVVAGLLDQTGASGDGGPATQALVATPIVAASTTDLFVSDGRTVREVDLATGLISAVAGTGVAPPSSDPGADDGTAAARARLSARTMAVGPGGTVYIASGADVRAFTVGGVIRTVVSPAAFDSAGCDPDPAAVTRGGAELVLVGCGVLRSWPADGSAADSSGTRLAGLDGGGGLALSADGAPLSRTFFPAVSSVAVSRAGQVAVASAYGVRTLASLDPSAPVTARSSEVSSGVSYLGDTLYASIGRGTPASPFRIVRLEGDGSLTTVLGSGSAPVADGLAGDDVRLGDAPPFVADSSGSRILFVWGGKLWSLTGLDAEINMVADLDLGLGTATSLAVDPSDGTAYVSVHGPWVSILRVPTDGTVDRLGGTSTGVEMTAVLPGDVLVGAGVGGVELLGPDGAATFTASAGAGPFGVAPDGSLVMVGGSPAGGFLKVSNVLAAPTTSAPLASVAAVAGQSSIEVTVHPPGVAGLHVTVVASRLPDAPLYPVAATTVATFDTDGSTTDHRLTLDRLAEPGTDGPVLVPGARYRIAVFTGGSSDTGLWSSAPATQVVTPTADVTAPAAPPVLVVSTISAWGVRYQVRAPDDRDVARIVVRAAEGTTPPASPTSGRAVADLESRFDQVHPGQLIDGTFDSWYTPFEAAKTYAFSAFALDASGNLSAARSVVRQAATASTVDPTVVTDLTWSFSNATGRLTVSWRGSADIAQIVAGSEAPTTPSAVAGLGVGNAEQASLDGAVVGKPYAVSVFRWNETFTHFSRVSAVITAGGIGTDSITLSAPASVAYGARPVLTAAVTRSATGATARVGQAGIPVELWRHSITGGSYVKVATGTTSSSGVVSWTLPAVTGGSVYVARVPAHAPTYPLVQSSSTRTVTVVRTVAATLVSGRVVSSVSVHHGKSITLRFAVKPATATTVRLQRYYSGAWHAVKTTRTASNGGWSSAVKTTSKGTLRYRLAANGSGALATGVSGTLTITAK